MYLGSLCRYRPSLGDENHEDWKAWADQYREWQAHDTIEGSSYGLQDMVEFSEMSSNSQFLGNDSGFVMDGREKSALEETFS